MQLALISSLFGKQVEKLMESLGGDAVQVVKNKIFEFINDEYNRNLNVKTLIHRNQPVNLLDVFVSVRLSNKSKYDNYISKKLQDKFTLETPEKLFEEKNYAVIIGDAGSGKSTLLQFLFLRSVDIGFFKIPIKIELRYLHELKINIREYIISRILVDRKIAVNEKIAIRILQKGKIIFFFDGYDEIEVKVKAKSTLLINSFMREFNNNYYIITSRPYTGIEYFPLCKNYYIESFDKEQINEFIIKQLSKLEKEIVEKIVIEVQSEKNVQYASFLSNPLLLSMFILTYKHNSEIPVNRNIFYQQVFDALFFEHDSLLKLSFQRKKNSNLNKADFEKVLMLLSFVSYFEKQFSFTKEYLLSLLTKIKTSYREIEFDSEAYLDDLLITVALLYKEGEYYSFSHLSLQEYFAAKYISVLPEEKKTIVYSKLINKYIFQPRAISDRLFMLDGSIKNVCLLIRDFNVLEYDRLFTTPLIDEIKKRLHDLVFSEGIHNEIKLIFLNWRIEEEFYEFRIYYPEVNDETFIGFTAVQKEIKDQLEVINNVFAENNIILETQYKEYFGDGKPKEYFEARQRIYQKANSAIDVLTKRYFSIVEVVFDVVKKKNSMRLEEDVDRINDVIQIID